MLHSIFGIFDKEELNKYKVKLMSFSGIPSEYITYKEVPTIDDEFIHAYIIDDKTIQNKPDLIITHGLFGSALLYYKILKDFSKHFRIIGIDLPGMGLSSRNDVEFKDFFDAEDYFLDRLEACFDNLELRKFFLIGFSLGSYVFSLYSLRYPEKVISLMLLSPVGLCYKRQHSEDKDGFWGVLRRFTYGIKRPPSLIYKMFGLFSHSVYTHAYGELWWIDDKEELEVFLKFNQHVFSNYITTEKVIFHFFNEKVQPYKPIIFDYEIIKDKKICLLYGEHDHNPCDFGKNFQELNPDNIHFDIINKSGHTLYGDNYCETKDKILDFFHSKGFINLKMDNDNNIKKDNYNNGNETKLINLDLKLDNIEADLLDL